MIHKNEVLTDNSKIETCRLCKTCKMRDNGDVWSNRYDKSCCQVYVYPEVKPREVSALNGNCDFYVKED